MTPLWLFARAVMTWHARRTHRAVNACEEDTAVFIIDSPEGQHCGYPGGVSKAAFDASVQLMRDARRAS